MIEIRLEHLEAVRNSSLQEELKQYVVDTSVLSRPLSKLSDDEYADLHDAVSDVLMNSAPIVEEFEAEQDKGVYSVQILGVPGAYFVTAAEYDSEGLFQSLDDARDCVQSNWGEFLVDGNVEDNE